VDIICAGKKNIIMFLLSTLLVVIIIGGFTSCNDSLDPIFYTLEQERPIVDDSLDNEITVHNVVTGGGYYFAAAPRIFYRTTSGTTWETANMPQSGVMCEAMEIFGTNLYAGFYKRNDGSSAGLFTAAPSTNLSWGSRITDDAFSDGELQIIMIKEANSFLLVSTAKKNSSWFRRKCLWRWCYCTILGNIRR